MRTMSTLAAPEREKEVRLEPPLTAEGLLRRRARQRPDGAALSDPPNRSTRSGSGAARSYTYREADAAVDALASFFIEIVLVPGDKIAVHFPISRCSRSMLLAAWRAGLTVAMLPSCGGAMRSAECARRSSRRR